MRRNQVNDHSRFQELAFLEIDGELSGAEIRALDTHIASCSDCRMIRSQAAGLKELLAAEVIEPNSDFHESVVSNLPPAPWEMRRPASWRIPLAASVLLVIAASLLTLRAPGAATAAPWLATLGAIGELFKSAALAGGGLLSASWTGLGMALGELFAQSKVGFVLFGISVLGLDFLLLRYLWSRHRERIPADGRASSRERWLGS